MTDSKAAKPRKITPPARDKQAPAGADAATRASAQATRPSEKVVAFVKRHPVLTLTGAIAAGVAVSALVPRRASRRLLGKAIGLAEAAGAAGAVIGRDAGEKTRALGRETRDQASALGDRADRVGHLGALLLEKYGQAAIHAASSLGKATAARANRIGDAATEQSRKARDLVSALGDRMMH